MDNRGLATLLPVETNYRYGQPQRAGVLTVVPIFGPDRAGRFAGPQSGLKLSQVRGYGNMELTNPAAAGVAIVPLHMGYIQDKAQNHALCGAAFIAAGQTRMFEDACCVQESQGGYLEGRDQWFFILPLQLRAAALRARGRQSYSKLWDDIGELNATFGLPERGHLEQIISRSRAQLTQYQNRFELLPGQTGALFFMRDRLAGIEIAPSVDYFAEVWPALVCFSYGVKAFHGEWSDRSPAIFKELPNPAALLPAEPFSAASLDELREQMAESRAVVQQEVGEWLALVPEQQFERQEEERMLDLRLETLTGAHFAGQVVQDGDGLVYASLFARPEYLRR